MPDAELQAVAREMERALGEEDLAKGRYSLKMNIYRFFAKLILVLVVACLWLPTGLAVALRNALHANAHWWSTWEAILVFVVVDSVFDFPIAWYFDFRVENRLGTNRQSFLEWLIDEVKQTSLNIVFTSLLFLGVYLIFRRFPERWIIGLAVLVVLFLVGIYLASPIFLRMQFASEPLDVPELNERLKALFERAGLRFAGVSVLKFGAKTARSNAAVVPKGVGNEVVVSDTLLDTADAEMIEAVVAHELGHKVHKDLLKGLIVLGIALLLTLAVGYWALETFGHWDGLQGPGDVATFPLLVLVVAWLAEASQVLLNIHSRREEAKADAFALRLTSNPEAFERAMILLAKQNKSVPLPPRWVELIFYDHPAIARRVLAARRFNAVHQT